MSLTQPQSPKCLTAMRLALAALVFSGPLLAQTLSVSPATLSIGGAGAWNTSVSVTAGSGVSWSASGTPAWLSLVTGRSSGTGAGSLALIAQPNYGNPRSAMVKVSAGSSSALLTVTQAGVNSLCQQVQVDDGQGGYYYETQCSGTGMQPGTFTYSQGPANSAASTWNFVTTGTDLNSDPSVALEFDLAYPSPSLSRCVVLWYPYAGTISVSDPVGGLQSGVIGSPTTIGRADWCAINLAAVTAAAPDGTNAASSGNQFTSTIPVQIGSAFPGPLTVTRVGYDQFGWDYSFTSGVIQPFVPLSQPPSIVTAPSAVTTTRIGPNELKYTVTAYDPNGERFITNVSLGLTTLTTPFAAAGACAVTYNRASSLPGVYSANNFSGGGSQCYLTGTQTATLVDSTHLAVTFDVYDYASTNSYPPLYVWASVTDWQYTAANYTLLYPGFTITPQSYNVPIGASRTWPAPLVSQLSGTAVLSYSGFPAGVTVSITGATSNSPNITVQVASTVPLGTYTGNITVTIGNAVRTVPLTVTVTPAPTASVNTTNLSIGGAGAWNNTVSITATPGTPWTATLQGAPAWLSIYSGASGTGNGTVAINALANASNGQTAVLNVTSGGGTIPVLVTVAYFNSLCSQVQVDDGQGGYYYETQCNGTGVQPGTLTWAQTSASTSSATWSFTTSAVDLNSDPGIVMEFDIGYPSSINQCAISWAPYTGTISVTDPAGGIQTGVIGTPKTIGRADWCQVNLAAVTASAPDGINAANGGNHLQSVIPVQISSALPGSLTVNRGGSDQFGHDFYFTAGTIQSFTPVNQAPAISITSVTEVSANEAIYTATASDQNGERYLTTVVLGLTSQPGGFPATGTCSVQYNRAVSFPGTTYAVSALPGSLCAVSQARSATVSGGNLVVTFDVFFSGSLAGSAGAMYVWGRANDWQNTQTALVSLLSPSFTMSAPPNVFVPFSSSARPVLTVTPNMALSGPVSLTVSGFPSGLTMSIPSGLVATSATPLNAILSLQSTAAVPPAIYNGNAVITVGPVSQTFPLSVTVTGTQAPQTIGFSPAFTSPPFLLTATASSGLPVSFASNTPAYCAVNGAAMTIVGAGTCSITASQPGGVYYAPAQAVTVSFPVSQLGQTISFSPPPSVNYSAGSFTLSASASSGLPLTVFATSPSVCRVSGTTVSIVALGACSLTVSQPGSTLYAPVSTAATVAIVQGNSGTVQGVTFQPGQGTYTTQQTINLSSTTTGAAIRFTLDGSMPTPTYGNLYQSQFTISASTVVNAIAYETGVAASPVASTSYTINLPVAAPTFSLAAGNYSVVETIALGSATPGASIRYTLDGSQPTETNGTLYLGAFEVGQTTTVNAIAFRSGLPDSPVSTATYTIVLAVVAPIFTPGSGNYTTYQIINLSSPTPDPKSFWFTLDGTDPKVNPGTLLPYDFVGARQGGILLYNPNIPNWTLKAYGTKTGWPDSPVTTGYYTVVYPSAVNGPVFSPASGSYNTTVWVSLSSSTAGAQIRYTLDGTTPTSTTGIPFTAQFAVTTSTSVHAIAFMPNGSLASSLATSYYGITNAGLGQPTITPASGAFSGSTPVTITAPGATIWFTTDGVTLPGPNTGFSSSSPANFTINSTTTIRAIALSGNQSSPITTAIITIGAPPTAVATPSFSPAGGTFTGSSPIVTISVNTSPATIFYTTDGSTPTQASLPYNGPIVVSRTETLKAIAVATGMTSPVATANYNVTLTGPASVAAPIVSPPGGSFTAPVTVVIQAAPGAAIWYTTDGVTTPGPNTGTLYAQSSFTVPSSTTVQAVAVVGGAQSPVAYSILNINPAGVTATPVFQPGAGKLTAGQTVQITSATPGATVYYTTDGSIPTTSSASTTSTTPIALSRTGIIRAMAVTSANTTSPSAVVAALYTMDSAQTVTSLSREYIRLGGRVVAIENTGPTKTFSLLGPPPANVAAAGSAPAFYVAADPQNGFSSDIALSVPDCPPVMTCSFNSTTLAQAGGSANLTISLTSGANVGNTYPMTLQGTSTLPAITQTIPFSITVTPRSVTPDFGITVGSQLTPAMVTTPVTYPVTVSGFNGFNSPVTLTVSGLPPGTTASFNPVTLPGPGTSTLTLTTSALTPASPLADVPPFTVTGNAAIGGVTTLRMAMSTLNVLHDPLTVCQTPALCSIPPDGNSGIFTMTAAGPIPNDVPVTQVYLYASDPTVPVCEVFYWAATGFDIYSTGGGKCSFDATHSSAQQNGTALTVNFRLLFDTTQVTGPLNVVYVAANGPGVESYVTYGTFNVK